MAAVLDPDVTFRSKMEIVLLALLCSLVAFSDAGKAECQPGLDGYQFLNTATDRCYQYVYEKDMRMTWSDARQYCQDKFGRLVNIDDKTKQSLIEEFLKLQDNPYVAPPGYDPYNNKTWGQYDPDIWIGASRDSDGVTWRFDTYAQSRTSRSFVLTWFNYGDDPVMLREMEAEKNKYSTDVCMFMRYTPTNITTAAGVSQIVTKYPWYSHLLCSRDVSKHTFICEYDTYEYRDTTPSNWIYVIGVLAVFVACGFFACTLYCLWDKIHTSYNVLQV